MKDEESRLKNKEYMREYWKKYREIIKESPFIYQKRLEYAREYAKEYRKKNKEKISQKRLQKRLQKNNSNLEIYVQDIQQIK